MSLATAVFGSGFIPNHQPEAQKEALWEAGLLTLVLAVNPERCSNLDAALTAEVPVQSHLRRLAGKSVHLSSSEACQSQF